MLVWFITNHHAHSTPPFRERRELRFSSGGAPPAGPSSADSSENEEPVYRLQPEDPEIRNGSRDFTKNLQRQMRRGFFEVLSDDDEDDKNKKAEKPDIIDKPVRKESQEAERPNAEKILQKVKTTHEKISSTHASLLKGRDEFLKKANNAELEKKWKEAENLLFDTKAILDVILKSATAYAEWERGKMDPFEFHAFLDENDHSQLENGTDFQNKVRRGPMPSLDALFRASGEHDLVDTRTDRHIPDIAGPEEWATLNESDKIFARQWVGDAVGIDDKLRYVEFMADSIDHEFEERNLGELQKVRSDFMKSYEGAKRKGNETLLDKWGRNFYSINQIFDGFKKWGHAYKTAITSHNNLQSSKIARTVGRAFGITGLPFTEEANRDLKQQLFSDNSKVIKEYKEYLSDYIAPKFREVFQPGGYLDQNQHDPNRVMAVLEYAASKGWLYDSLDGLKKDPKEIFGRNLRKLIPPSYMENRQFEDVFTSLFGKNKKGGDEEMKKWAERAEIFETEDEFVTAFRIHMGNLNFWAGRGVMEAALKKGKEGRIPAVFAAEFMNMLQTMPEMRKYMEPHVLHQFGALTFGLGTFTPTHVISDKKNLMTWMRKHEKGSPELTEEAGVLGGAVGRIQQAILAKGVSLPSDPVKKGQFMASIVGKVLSTEIVELGEGKYISIFEDAFTDYRKNEDVFRIAGDFVPSRESDDYYNSQSEILLMPKERIYAVLDVDTKNALKNDQKARRLMGWILYQNQELRDRGLDKAADNFQDEMRPKLDYTFDQIIASGKEANYPIYDALIGHTNAPNGISRLYHAGFISKSVIEKTKNDDFYTAVTGETRQKNNSSTSASGQRKKHRRNQPGATPTNAA